jgi:hypothetical protein
MFHAEGIARTIEVVRYILGILVTNSDAAARGYIDEGRARELFNAVRKGERGPVGLWEILTLEMWLRRYWR